MSKKMKGRSGSKIDGNEGGNCMETSPNPQVVTLQQSASALNSAGTSELKELLVATVGLITVQQQQLSALKQQVKEQHDFKRRFKLMLMMKERNLEFVGTYDPMEAEDWIMEVEKHFELFETTDEDKVGIAAFLLNDGAHYWWKSVRSSHPETAGPITWATFKSAFYKRYLPIDVCLQKEREFIGLKQGDRTVAEYELEFSRLARFAPHLVKDDHSRARRFVQGLKPEIRILIVCSDPKTFLQARNSALSSEFVENEIQAENEVQAPNEPRNRKRGRFNNHRFGGRHNNRMP